MNNLSKITLATLFAITSGASFASPVHSSANVSGMYAELAGGYGSYQADNFGNAAKKGFIGNVGVGYLWALPNEYNNFAAGLEVSGTWYPNVTTYGQSGTIDAASAKTKASSVNVLGVVKYFVDEKVSLFAKAGPNFFRARSTINNGPSTTLKDTGVMADVGAAYNVTPALALTADFQYSWITLKDPESKSQTNVNPYGVLVGVTYNFGAA
jgi:hypothetical protein